MMWSKSPWWVLACAHAGVASLMFQTLAENNINIQMISTSEIKVSVLIQEQYLEKAVKSLHTAFGLDHEDGDSKVVSNNR